MIINDLTKIVQDAFKSAGYDLEDVKVIKSNRPDLCDYQCDSVFKCAKMYHQNPSEIGERIVSCINSLKEFNDYFEKVEFAPPGFINITISDKLINKCIENIMPDIRKSLISSIPETYVIDYGGANVAKPLHVGHMRTAIVGESISRIIKYKGHNVITDVHLGDYGLQMGQVIYGILRDNIDINDIDIKYLDKIYPEMSGLCKEDETIKNECAEITKKLQDGDPLYQKLWKKIMEVSLCDIKKNYDYLSVHFDLWYGESDAYEYLNDVEAMFNNKNLLEESEGALIVRVNEESDKKEMPPLLFKNSVGSYLYASTDLGTIYQRVKDYNPNHILYITDLRQALHFEQVFRAADKVGLINKASLEHLGYGTVNGSDGKPYKTRSGDSPKLEGLFNSAKETFITKKESNKYMNDADVDKIVNSILKFADLSNCREKDYIFDLNKFSDVTGKTGPYILYTYLRINKILKEENLNLELTNNIYNKVDRDLRFKILEYSDAVENAFKERMPHYIADYVYNLCVACNIFYQNNHIIGMEDEIKKNDWIYVLTLANKIIKDMLDLLVIEIPEAM